MRPGKIVNIIIMITLIVSGISCGNKSQNSAANPKYTFILIHLEAGYKACKDNNLPPSLTSDSNVHTACTKSLGWQEYFWPTVIELVQKADALNMKLTLAMNPQWAEYILKDTAKVALVRTWQANGHEIALHHHDFTDVDWNGYSNRTDVTITRNSLYLGPVNNGFAFVENLASPYPVSVGTIGDVLVDVPSLMDLANVDIIFGEGNESDSYPQLGTVRGLKPYRDAKPNGGYRVHFAIREYSTVMQITLNEALPILQDQYITMSDNEVFGIVWHEFDYYQSKSYFDDWFAFMQQQGATVRTMSEINTRYPF